MTGVAVSTPILAWVQRRSGRDEDDFRDKFSEWDAWVSQESRPTLAEVSRLADFSKVSVGYFFLPEPPDDKLPIPDLRAGRARASAVSADLMDTIHLNQRRQAWYEDYATRLDAPEPLPFVGSAASLSVDQTASIMTKALDYSVARREKLQGAAGARRHLAAAFESLGGLVVLNSMVGNRTSRMLDLDEFRGFTLHSDLAPLVFVNSHDTLRGQVFSLLHEFAHVWRGESRVSQGGDPLLARDSGVERWCDAVAAQIAVPAADLGAAFQPHENLTAELDRLADRYLCSTLVILIRLRETSLLSSSDFEVVYRDEVRRLVDIVATMPKGGGGNFYLNQRFRIGQTLGRAIIRDAELGETPMTEAMRLLGFRRLSVFDRHAELVGAE